MQLSERSRRKITTSIAVVLFFTFPAVAQDKSSPIEIVPQIGHQSGVLALAFSPDGRQIISGSADRSIKLWDVDSGRELRTFSGHTRFVTAVKFLPDGRRIISGSGDDTIRLWDVKSGRELRKISFPRLDATLDGNFIRALSVSPDGQRIVSGGSQHGLTLWDVEGGRELRTFYTSSFTSFSPDGRSIVSDWGGGGMWGIRLWDAESGRELHIFRGHKDRVLSAAFSPDGRRIASVSLDNTIKLWDVDSGRELQTFIGDTKDVGLAAFSPDGRRIASQHTGDTIKLWDVDSGRELYALGVHGSPNGSFAFSPDGRRFASGTVDGTIELWDLDSGREIRTFSGHADLLTSVKFLPDGRRIVSGSWYGGIKLWSADSGKELQIFSDASRKTGSVDVSANGGRIVSGGNDSTSAIKLWDADSGRLLHTFSRHAKGVALVAISSDGRRIVSSTGDKTIELWDVKSGRVLHSLSAPAEGLRIGVAISPDGRRIASGDVAITGKDSQKTVRLWDADSGRLLHTFSKVDSAFSSYSALASFFSTYSASASYFSTLPPSLSAVAFSPDSRRVASGSGENIKLWDVSSLRELYTFRGHTGEVESVAFSPDGRRIASASSDNTIKLWDVDSGRELFTFSGHAGEVKSVAFSSDGRWLVSASGDGTEKLWDVQSKALIGTEVSLGDGEWIFLTPEGFFDSSPNGAKKMVLVRGLESYSIDQFYDALHRPDLVHEKLAGDPRGLVRAAAARLDLSKAVASGSAPRVTIVPPASSTVNLEQVTIEANVVDQSGGIGKVEWRVNGTTLGVETPSAAPAQVGRVVTVRKTLTLEPGQNRIEVVAYNAQGLIASDAAQVVITLQGQEAKTSPRLYVLTVGVNDYWDSRLHLAFAVPDAQAIGDALSKGGKGLYERVEVTMALDGQATASQLDRTFTELSQKVRPQDVFVFFLSGHGKTVDGRFYFIPQDFKYTGEESITTKGIGQDQLQQWLARVPARKSVLLFDACESGSLTEDQNKAVTRGMEEMTAIDRLTHAMGRTILTATTDDKPAAEGLSGHGVFTYALLKSLGEAQTDADGLIEVAEMASYVDRTVPELSYEAWKIRQVPQMKIVGSNFPLSHKVAMLQTGPDGPIAVISKTSTHVVIAPVTVRQSASETAASVIQLTPGTQVRLMQTDGGWVLIARDGKKLGYVQQKALLTLQ